MPRHCHPIEILGGHGFICGNFSVRKEKCVGCGRRTADRQCDAVVGLYDETCDAHICTRCAISRGDGLDLCPAHRDEFC